MKKILFAIISFFLVVASYAKSYDELLKEAESYEAKKEWFYALGAYYEAAKISEGSETAGQKYKELNSVIKNGKPGYGEFNDFTLHDEWVNLIKNAEKYFTETFPYSITFDNLESSSIDYEKKTADYKLSLDVKNTNFYDDALEVLKSGYKKVHRADWKDLESDTKNLWFMSEMSDVGYVGIHNTGIMSYPIYMPVFTGMYKVSAYNSKYENFEKSNELSKLQTDANNVYKNDGVALSYFASTFTPLSSHYANKYPGIKGIGVCEAPAFVAKFSTNGKANRRIEMSIGNIDFLIPFYGSGKQTCYDLKLGICDENGNLVIEGTRQTICTDKSSYIFNNIPQTKLQFLDTDYNIRIIGIWLNYGLYDITLLTDDDVKNDTIRGIVKSLPDIKIKTDNVEFIDKKILEEQERLEKERLAKLEEEKKVAEAAEWSSFIAEMENVYNDYLNQIVTASENMKKIQELIGCEFSIRYYFYQNRSKVERVVKKSLAAKHKLTQEYKLIMIDGKDVDALISEADEYKQLFAKMRSLIYDAKELQQDSWGYKKKQIMSEFKRMKYKSNYLMYPKDTYSRDKDGWYYADIHSGSVLLFVKTDGLYDYPNKTIKITVP